MLCFGYLESGKFEFSSKTLQHKMSSGYVYPANSLYICICVYVWSRCWYLVPLAFLIHIRRGLSVACSDEKAIPEPKIAEQQQCSPAFLLCL